MSGPLTSTSGRRWTLGREFARGGEGALHEVDGASGVVAKMYLELPDAAKVEKLSALLATATPGLGRVAAWPSDLLFDPAGRATGILMPKVIDRRPIHDLYGPASRKQHFPRADWGFLVHAARNAAAAVEAVHGAGHVIGDLNESGFLVAADATVRMIDCDSFQIRHGGRTYRCGVGKPEYTPPELQEGNYGDSDRSASHDGFGLAVLIFQLLFMGRHPFAGVKRGAGETPTIDRSIAGGHFAYSRRVGGPLSPAPHTPRLDFLPNPVGALFERAFTIGDRRPTAAEWRAGLDALARSLQRCTDNPQHRFPAGSIACPWCAIIDSSGPDYFPYRVVPGAPPARPPEFDDGFDLLAFLERLQAIPFPAKDLPIPQVPLPKPAPLPAEADTSRLPAIGPMPRPPVFQPEPLPPLPVYTPELDAATPPDAEPVPPWPVPTVRKVPPKPQFAPVPLPTPPTLERPPDAAAHARRLADELRGQTEHRLVKWGAVVAAAVAAVAGVLWAAGQVGASTAVAGGVSGASLGLAFAIAWYVSTRDVARQVAAERRRIDRIAADVLHENDLVQARHEAVYREAEAKARLRTHRHEAAMRAWQETAEQVKGANAAETARFDVARPVIAAKRATAEAKNAARIEAWKVVVDRHEAPRLEAWRLETARVQYSRDSADWRNANAWRIHESRMCEHHAAVAKHEGRAAAWEAARRKLSEVRSARSRIVAAARLRRDDVRRRWEAEYLNACATEMELNDLSHELLRNYEAQKTAYLRDVNLLGAGERASQMRNHLESAVIAYSNIPGVGPNRLGELHAYGYETAADIDGGVINVPGIGPHLRDQLVGWRRLVEQCFRFDALKSINPADLRRLLGKYRGDRDASRQRMTAAAGRSEAFAARCRERKAVFAADLLAAERTLAQAVADERI